jgi:ribose transport system substrate-binding protein
MHRSHSSSGTHRKLAIAATLVAAATVLTMSGCSSSGATAASAKPLKFVLVNGSDSDEFFISIADGAKAEAAKHGVSLEIQAPHSFDYVAQRPLLDSVISQKPDGIILSPDSDSALNPSLKTAKSLKIPVVEIETEKNAGNNPDVMSFIADNQLLLGKAAADAVGPKLASDASVGVILSVSGSLGTEQRGKGFVDEIKAKYPSVKILPEQYSQDDRQKAQSIATDMMLSNPKLGAIFTVDSLTGQGAQTAVKANGKAGKVLLAGVDADSVQVAGLRSGIASVLIAQPAYNFGVKTVDALLAIVRDKKKVARSVTLPPITVTHSNIDSAKSKQAIYDTK